MLISESGYSAVRGRLKACYRCADGARDTTFEQKPPAETDPSFIIRDDHVYPTSFPPSRLRGRERFIRTQKFSSKSQCNAAGLATSDSWFEIDEGPGTSHQQRRTPGPPREGARPDGRECSGRDSAHGRHVAELFHRHSLVGRRAHVRDGASGQGRRILCVPGL